MVCSRRAVIDVGTNSVKLLVADVEEHAVAPVFEDSEQTRLGRGFYDTHQLLREAIEDTAMAVAQFAAVARLKNATSIRVFATSAARDAVNRDELLEAIAKAAGLTVEVISGEQEAEWVYQGVRSDPGLREHRLLIFDVGGGSSEFILGADEHPQFARSFPLGSVRLLELIQPDDPPRAEQLRHCREWLQEFFAVQVRPALAPLLTSEKEKPRLVGTGGTATILARMEYALDKYHRHAIEGARISAASVSRWMDQLWAMPLAERKRIVGLPKKRADVILTGLAIYDVVLREFGFPEVQASTRGLRFAAVLHDGAAPQPAVPPVVIRTP